MSASNPNHVCTATNPYDPMKHAQADHPDAVEIERYRTGGLGVAADPEEEGQLMIVFQCPHCGIAWEEEE